MSIHIRNQEIDFVCLFVCFVVVSFAVYNTLLLNHLWSCVLKPVSELHDFI